jgi:phosphopantothenoylcysteine decarboxylase/phosphopantothenate--cysteine ligase
MLQNKKILLGVTGSIAAYKACDLVQRLKEKGASVRVVMTHSATRIVHPNTFAALSGHPVLTDAWEGVSTGAMPHIDAARWADLFLIAPCTAHTIAELSMGLTGSAVSMTALAYKGSLAVAPAMNTVMLDAAPVREHLQRLTARGVHVLPTQGGNLACGEVGEGKLTTPEEITAYTELILEAGRVPAGDVSLFGTLAATTGLLPDASASATSGANAACLSSILTGKRVLISGGHTEEPLDGVRFLSNRSSGKTAVAIARAFRLCGADVHLVLGRAEEQEPNGVLLTRVRTSAEFRAAMLASHEASDVVVMAAAIADFVPTESDLAAKWKGSRDLKTVGLSPTPNILAELGQAKRDGQVLVGFALETEGARARALEKMESRHCDLMVVNTPLARPGMGFGADAVMAAVLSPASLLDGSEDADLRVLGKDELAVLLVRRTAEVLKGLAGSAAGDATGRLDTAS